MFSFILLFQDEQPVPAPAQPSSLSFSGGGGKLKASANRRIRYFKIKDRLPQLRASATATVIQGVETIFKGFTKKQRINGWIDGRAGGTMVVIGGSAKPMVKKRDLALQLVMGSMEVEDFR